MNITTLYILSGLVFILCITTMISQNKEIKKLENVITNQNKVIEIDDQLIEKHERELEFYGDFIVAILDGEDKERILMKEAVPKAGAKMTEIRKEIRILLKTRKAGDIRWK